jgi:hemolysin III
VTAAETHRPTPDYPPYRRGEEIADRCIHLFGMGSGIGAAAALLALAAARHDGRLILATAVYALGLIAMLVCSALYNMAPPSPVKEWLRRLDRAAIFLMIAGTYAPFLLGRIGGAWGLGMFAFVALVAGIGAVIAVAMPRRFERLQLASYLLLAWSVAVMPGRLAAALAPAAILLLFLGGVIYTVGVVFHLWRRLSYHNAIWHGFVLVAAGCHYAAVLVGVVLPVATL